MATGVYKRTEEQKEILRERNKGRRHTIEAKEKMSKASKGRKLTKEWKYKIGIGNLGKIISEEARKKISISLTGKKASLETRKKMSESHKGLKHSNETKRKMGKYKKNDLTLRKMRNAAIKRIEDRFCFNGYPIPLLGRHETIILDNLENCLGFKILRQHRVSGYFLDGYIPSLNLAIEVDEKHHRSAERLSKDKIRENNIINEIHCSFLRLNI